MAKKDQSIVAIISGLTPTQAADIQADIIKSKKKHAPNARAIASLGHKDDVGNMLNQGQIAIGTTEVKVDDKKQKS